MEKAGASYSLDENRKVSFRFQGNFIFGSLSDRFSEVEEMVSIRQTTFGSIAKRQHLQEKSGIDLDAARLYEARALISVCELARSHNALQHALSASTHLNGVASQCQEVNLDISAVAALQTANVLWDQGEKITSIRMLQSLVSSEVNIMRQDISIALAELLTTLVSFLT